MASNAFLTFHEQTLRSLVGPYFDLLRTGQNPSVWLLHSNRSIRVCALLMVGREWPITSEVEAICRRMALEEEDVELRAIAITSWCACQRNKNDRRVVRLLVSIVKDERATSAVRLAAYQGLHAILDVAPLEWPDVERGIEVIDWRFIDSIASDASPLESL